LPAPDGPKPAAPRDALEGAKVGVRSPRGRQESPKDAKSDPQNDPKSDQKIDAKTDRQNEGLETTPWELGGRKTSPGCSQALFFKIVFGGLNINLGSIWGRFWDAKSIKNVIQKWVRFKTVLWEVLEASCAAKMTRMKPREPL